jgi:arylsulfatase A-like enzyme
MPSLQGKLQETRPAMVTTNVGGLQALRHGKCKYVDGKFPDNVPDGLRRNLKREAEPALYDLVADPSETKNLLVDHPEIVDRMQGIIDSYRTADSSR